jgi:zinc transporter, ZIP family
MSAAISFTDIFMVIGITLFAGGTSFIGAIIGKDVNFSKSILLFLTAFGAGILISAAIFEMVIQAEKSIGIISTLLFFILGAIIFTIADVIAVKKGGGADILLGIGLDTIPESLAIGASIAAGPAFAIALLIGIQNIPEGIAAYKEMRTGKTAFTNSKKALCFWHCIHNTCYSWIDRTIFFTRLTLYNRINIGIICRRYILYAFL